MASAIWVENRVLKSMSDTDLYRRIVSDLVAAVDGSNYAADANEPDPRYKGYGVRKPAVDALIKRYRKEISALTMAQKLAFSRRLIKSGYGEQKTVALAALEQIVDYFSPDHFLELESLIRGLHGWSKIDSYTGSLLRDVLVRHPTAFLALLDTWNRDEDPWLRRASVVIFTRKVAATGKYHDVALRHCERLKHAEEDLVRKGVGWALKDLMRTEEKRVLEYVVSLRKQHVSSVITLYALRGLSAEERRQVI